MVSRRYASALLDMAVEADLVDQVAQDIETLSAMVQESDDLRNLIRNPRFDREQQMRALDALAAKAGLQKLTVNFLGVLSLNRRVGALETILVSFREALQARRGETRARVESAYPLNDAQLAALRDRLGQSAGGAVSVDVTVNPELLGGMIVTIGSRMIDDSVRGKLERLRRAMMSEPYQNQSMKEVG